MRKKLVVFSFIFLVLNICVAQQNWIIVDAKSDFPEEKIKEVIPIVNEEENNLALFFKTKKGLEAYLYNDKQELVNHISIDKLPSKSDVVIGNAYHGMNYQIFFSNNSESQFSVVSLNFKTGEYQITEDLGLEIKGEKFIKYVNHQNTLYLLTLEHLSSVLKLYTFKMDGSVKTSRFDLSNEIFVNDNGLEYDLSTLLYNNNVSNNEFMYVQSGVPTSLEVASSITKAYYQNNHLIITNNLYDKFTYNIDIDITNDSYSLSKIENTHFVKERNSAISNSFVIDSFILNTYAHSDNVFLDIYKNGGSELLKTFVINKDEEITFKNSPIIIQNGNPNNLRETEKTSKFIKNVSRSLIGVSAYKINDSFILTLGSVSPKSDGGFIFVGAVIGGLVGAAIFAAFYSYSQTQSTRINCLFDENFNHVSGDILLNGFDKINHFIINNKLKYLKHQTVFKFKDQYIWGSYNKTAGFYRLYSFNLN
ncbi:hypothetical protein [Hanstruepera marina]|uniref:hypothetical protein n=1 Tax=Hanstruepera marina TaxID=2873265 RepID=UPI001CA74C26|nr:hypothetical protein [Hanstruepera marina]